MRTLLIVPAALALSLACGGDPPPPDKPACPLAGNQLGGHTFVMVDTKPQGDTLDRRARMRFEQDGDGLELKYTVKSLVNVYDYTCEEGRNDRLKCVTEPDLGRICRSLEVHEPGSCTAEKIEGLGFSVDAEDFEEAKKETGEEIAKMKESPQWDQYKLMFNNVGNAVQGVVYAKVDERKCRLNVDDMMTIVYEGETKQDYNPVGANPFAEVDEDLLFTNCPNEAVLADHDAESLPEDLNTLAPLQDRKVGEPVHYFYLDEVALEPEEGCRYSVDIYTNYVKAREGVAIEASEEGKLQWNTSHTWSDEDRMPLAKGKKGGVFTMVRHKTCGDETETIDAVCNYTVF